MFRDLFGPSQGGHWNLVGLLIFMVIFLGVLAYVFFGLRDKDKIDELAALPLAEDDVPGKPADAKTTGEQPEEDSANE